MDVYDISLTAASNNPAHLDYFPIDDLLDFSNEDLFSSSSSSSSSSSTDHSLLLPPPPPPPPPSHLPLSNFNNYHSYTNSLDFNHHLSLPSDDVAELEWLSQFVDDSFADIPTPNSMTGNVLSSKDAAPVASQTTSFLAAPGVLGSTDKSRTKRSRLPGSSGSRAAAGETESGGGVRRCTHCASEKTPQWRTGPLGPKTLCNACGVRYKSGRLVPEYRPASSPTFVLTQHSNSHRKVLELRRQKELLLRQQQLLPPPPPPHHQNFGLC